MTDSEVRNARMFWSRRVINMVTSIPNLQQSKAAYAHSKAEKQLRQAQEKQLFLDEHTFRQHNNMEHTFTETNNPQRPQTNIPAHLLYWIFYKSWSFCGNCGLLERQKLLPSFLSNKNIQNIKHCLCEKDRYIVPKQVDFPQELLLLTKEDIIVLRPFDLHNGDYERMQHGYRRKHGMTRVTPSKKSVSEKIQLVTDPSRRQKLTTAYHYLSSSNDSGYSDFLRKREACLANSTSLNLYDIQQSEFIECALWPHLYPKKKWCETSVRGNESRLSSKVSFLTKCLSGIVDYSLDYDILQFHYDLWLFRTVSGAVSVAKKTNCSPARALEEKPFSEGYWRWQHRMLLDAIRQFGYPGLFLTISPYEWTFPFPEWLDNLREATGKHPTTIAGLETIHIAHVLEQIVRGYLCGSSSNRWRRHVFSYNGIPSQSNIQTYFYRFEFQQRGTVHLHLLVWLKNAQQIQHHLIRADIPWEDPELAYLVNKLQKSDKGSLPHREEPTAFVDKVLQLHHPADAFIIHLRAYLTTLLPTLKCSMDIQTTDGRSMILRYVTSYVTKWHDGFHNEKLYSLHVTPYEAAYRHVKDFNPCEPEMWLQLCAIKTAWSSSRTKKYVPPLLRNTNSNATVVKYRQRPKNIEHLTLLQWLRKVDHTKQQPIMYKHGTTLVGVKYVSYSNPEFFHQQLLMHHPHRTANQLLDPDHERLPEQLKHFSAATRFLPDPWNSSANIQEHLQKEGHKETYIATIVSFTDSLHNVLRLWKSSILSTNQLDITSATQNGSLPLHPEQQVVVDTIEQRLLGRQAHYASHLEMPTSNIEYDNSDAEDEQETALDNASEYNHEPIIDAHWNVPVYVKGKPGTGKTHTIHACIHKALANDCKVLVAAPTGFLASSYSNIFLDDIDSQTVHSSFFYPVLPDETPKINWNISDYDLVIIDEISMIPNIIYQHIVLTLRQITIQPIVILGGDVGQLQPIYTSNRRTMQVQSPLHDRHFYNNVTMFTLYHQHRCHDPEYTSFLNHVRDWVPTQDLLDTIQNEHVLCDSESPSDYDISQAFNRIPEATILTVTRKAASRVNKIVISTIFQNRTPIKVIPCDNDDGETPIFLNMRVMITQNRDKKHGVVNGQTALIHSIEKATIILKLPSGSLAHTYPVTFFTPTGQRRVCYPFTPAYAVTICKAQGQTLQKAAVWFDTQRLAPGTAYVALSRVKTKQDIWFLTPAHPYHFTAVDQQIQ